MISKKKTPIKKGLEEETFDFESYKEEVISGLMNGKGLLGEEGLLKPLIAKFVEAALEAELSSHLDSEKKEKETKPNKRNGKRGKEICGWLTIKTVDR